MAGVMAVNDANFDQEVVKANGVVLVDFYAPWCGPCKKMSPVIESLSEKYNGKMKFVKLNTDENPATAGRYEIYSIPTLLLFKNGNIVDRLIGYMPEGAMEKFLEKHLNDKVSN
jgi:thioredoxin 1